MRGGICDRSSGSSLAKSVIGLDVGDSRRVFVIDGLGEVHDLRLFRRAVAVQAHFFQQLGGDFGGVLALGVAGAAEEFSATTRADDHRLAALVAVDVGG